MKKSKAATVWTIVLAILLVLTVVVNIVLTGPLYTVMNMYFGKGDVVIKNSADAENMDTEYYKSEYGSEEELHTASQ